MSYSSFTGKQSSFPQTGGTSSRQYNAQNQTFYHSIPEDLDDAETRKPIAPGWTEYETTDHETYYVNHRDRRTTWIRPTEPRVHSQEQLRIRRVLELEFGAQLVQQADSSRYRSPAQSLSENNNTAARCRYSVFTGGRLVIETTDQTMAVIEQLRELYDRGQDCVCLVENIDKQGIQSLNDLDFPGRNVVGEAANTVFNNDPVRTGNCLQIIDDIVESAEYLGQSVMRRASSKERSRKLQLVEEVLETLYEVSLAVKTSIENWNMSGAYTEDLDCVASCAAELQQTLDRLTQEAASIPLGLDDLQMSVRALWKQMQNLRFLRRRRYFNMSARLAYGGSSKTDGRSSGPSAPCGNPCLSLIRVNKCICQ